MGLSRICTAGRRDFYGRSALRNNIFTARGKPSEIVRRLVDAYRPDRVYLFGSAARGDAGPNSDYDLLVVVPDDAPADRQSCAKGYEALRGIGVLRDVVVYTARRFDGQLHLKASFPSTVVREGKLLYGG